MLRFKGYFGATQMFKVCNFFFTFTIKKPLLIFGAKAFTSLQQCHLQIITIISLANDASKQTVNRDILVMACQSFSLNDCVCYPKREQFELLLFSFELTHTIVSRETLASHYKNISVNAVCLDESFARDIMVMICK